MLGAVAFDIFLSPSFFVTSRMKYLDLLAKYRTRITTDLRRSAPKIFFCHVPKCAGTALSQAIAQQAYPLHQVLLVPRFSFDLEAVQSASTVCSLPKVDVRQVILSYNLASSKYRYGKGHVYCRPRLVDTYRNEWHFVTILRNPVDRWISEYTYNTYKSHHWAKNTLSLQDYIQSEKGKGTAESFLRYFSSIPYPYSGDPKVYIDEAIENLKRFSVIGTVERFDEWCKSFETVFGRKLTIPRINASPKKEVSEQIKNDAFVMDKVASLCDSDMQIYKYFCEHNA
jgi:hypothetical protein